MAEKKGVNTYDESEGLKEKKVISQKDSGLVYVSHAKHNQISKKGFIPKSVHKIDVNTKEYGYISTAEFKKALEEIKEDVKE